MKKYSILKLSIVLTLSFFLILASFMLTPCLADRIDDLYLEAMELEDSAVSKEDYKAAANIYQKLVDEFSENENVELIAASLFSIGDINLRRLDDKKRAYSAFNSIKTDYSDSSWYDRADQEIDKLKSSGFKVSSGFTSSKNLSSGINKSAMSGFGVSSNTDMGGFGIGGLPQNKNNTTGFDTIADKIDQFGNSHLFQHKSGFTLSADKSRWNMITSIPQPGFLMFLRPVNSEGRTFPSASLTAEENFNMSTSKNWATKIKSEAASMLPLYKIIAEQDILIGNINVHEIFSYYVNNDKGIIQKQTFIPYNDMMFTFTCSDFKDTFMKTLEEFKKLTRSIKLK